MIVVCIKEFNGFTVGKKYKADKSVIIGYYILDDDNLYKGIVEKRYFMEIGEYRQQRINEIEK